jgi:hypothetical protein
MLNEAEARLRDSAEEAARAGKAPEEAEAEAVRLFGEADALIVSSAQGSGQWLSAAAVALGAASVFGAHLVRDLRAAG